MSSEASAILTYGINVGNELTLRFRQQNEFNDWDGWIEKLLADLKTDIEVIPSSADEDIILGIRSSTQKTEEGFPLQVSVPTNPDQFAKWDLLLTSALQKLNLESEDKPSWLLLANYY